MSKRSVGKCNLNKCWGTPNDPDICPETCGCVNAKCNNKICGQFSDKTGYMTIAAGTGSHSEGSLTKACGANAHSEGYKTKACAENSHTENYMTIACGPNSHAEGMVTKAGGTASHTEGANTIALGHCSHAEGLGTEAKGHKSHSEGGCTIAGGDASHSEGNETLACGKFSHSGGSSSVAKQQGQWARGAGMFCILGDAQTSIYHLRGKGYPGSAILTLNGCGEETCESLPIVPLGHSWAFHVIISGLTVPPPCPPNAPAVHNSWSVCCCGLAQREGCNDVTTVLMNTATPLSTGLTGTLSITASTSVKGGIVVAINTPSYYSNWFCTMIVSQVGLNLNNIPNVQ